MQTYGNRVAVIGAGPSGLAAARFLKAHGFFPVVYEQGGRIGGQWNAGAANSGIWPGMRANTSRVMTRFGDLDYPGEVAMFPTSEDVRAYLEAYSEWFGLTAHLRLDTAVETLARHPAGGWAVHSRTSGAVPRTELYARVVVATGRYTRPALPRVAGLSSFAGRTLHSFDYRGPGNFETKTVLIAGCSISALEIACELAAAGATVITTMRRQRYVAKKLADGVPIDNVALTRAGAWAAESLPREAVAAELKRLVLRTSGHPADAGALAPADDIDEAGVTLSDRFLEYVAAGRIVTKPWLARVDGPKVHFTDGSAAAPDTILFATGFSLDLPFLHAKARGSLGLRAGGGMELYDFTFHPDLDGLAFLGLFPQIGPYFPVVELQARWASYVWAGLAPAPSDRTMRDAIAADCQAGASERVQKGHLMALRFARRAGVEPDIAAHPGLARALLFGPLSPASFRLCGPDKLSGAAWETMAEAARFGAVRTPVFTADERSTLAVLAAARRTELCGLLNSSNNACFGETRRAA